MISSRLICCGPAAQSRRDRSILGRLLQDVVEEPFTRAVLGSLFRTERRSLLLLSQGGKQRSVELLGAGSFRLGFDNELVARFPDRALGGQLPKRVPDRPGIRAVDACLELEFHLG